MMREINVKDLIPVVRKLCIDANILYGKRCDQTDQRDER